MSDYQISKVYPSDKRTNRLVSELLIKEGIRKDGNLDYTCAMFDDDMNVIATGSCFGNTLRCMAVDSSHQGEGLMNQVVTALMDYQFSRGCTDLFLYTKITTARFFRDLGFYEIARVEGKLVFMENRRTGFENYLKNLQRETEEALPQITRNTSPEANGHIGAVIMNANPFTLGHQYLIEQASSRTELLHVFVVSEDVSLVPLTVREQLVKEGSAVFKNLIFHRTGPYMISNATFPSYFLKDSDTVIRSHARLDIEIFTRIASALGITDRFVGEEPFSQVTGIYNQVMKEELESAGLTCTIIPRKTGNDGAISASDVRTKIKEGDFEALRALVPETTYRYFTSEKAEPVIAKIRGTAEVRHY